MARELLKLRMKHGLSLNDVADICGIDVMYVARMELGAPVDVFYASGCGCTWRYIWICR
jgi:transcriptional regulator with XRE-family HTH domain